MIRLFQLGQDRATLFLPVRHMSVWIFVSAYENSASGSYSSAQVCHMLFYHRSLWSISARGVGSSSENE